MLKNTVGTSVPTQYIHPKINLSDLHESANGILYLLSDENREKVRNADLSKNRRIKGSELGLPRDILIIDKVPYILYEGEKKGHHLGSGGYAAVKLVQHLETGELFALKMFSQTSATSKAVAFTSKKIKDRGEKENEFLKKTRESLGELTTHSRKKLFQFYILMKLARGQDLYFLRKKLKNSTYSISTSQCLNLAKKFFEEVQKLHAKNILHADIKPENIIFDPITEHVTLIDRGLSLHDEFLKEMPDLKARPNIGTPITSAPETAQGTYSTKSDVYSIGATLAYLFNMLTYNPQTKEKSLVEEAPLHAEQHKNPIADVKTRLALYDFLKRCMDPNPTNRPTIDYALRLLNAIEEVYSKSATQPVSVGILNADEYLSSNIKEKDRFQALLAHFDRIVVVDKENNRTTAEYSKLRARLEQKDIIVEDRVIQSSALQSAIESVPVFVEAEKKPPVMFTHITHNPLNLDTTKITTMTLSPPSHAPSPDIELEDRSRQLRKANDSPSQKPSSLPLINTSFKQAPFQKDSISEEFHNKLVAGLVEEDVRLVRKYSDGMGNIKNPIADERHNQLVIALFEIKELFQAGKLDYLTTKNMLTRLQDNMQGAGGFARSFNLFYKSNSIGRKNIANLIDALEKEYHRTTPSPK